MYTGQSAWIYVLSSYNKNVLYVGVTTNLERRISEHKSRLIDGFTKKYNVDCLVYIEECKSIQDAIAREKQIKCWRREKKSSLISSQNPEWKDLASDI